MGDWVRWEEIPGIGTRGEGVLEGVVIVSFREIGRVSIGDLLRSD